MKEIKQRVIKLQGEFMSELFSIIDELQKGKQDKRKMRASAFYVGGEVGKLIDETLKAFGYERD